MHWVGITRREEEEAVTQLIHTDCNGRKEEEKRRKCQSRIGIRLAGSETIQQQEQFNHTDCNGKINKIERQRRVGARTTQRFIQDNNNDLFTQLAAERARGVELYNFSTQLTTVDKATCTQQHAQVDLQQ